MKTLILIPSVHPEQGGPVKVLRQFADLQARDGDSLCVATCDGPDDECVRYFPHTIKAFGPCSTFYGYNSLLIPWLREHASEFDVVVVHGIWQFHSLAARWVLPALGVPYVIYAHGMLDPGHNRVSRLKQLKKQLYWWPVEYWVLRAAAAVFLATGEEQRIAPQSFWPQHWHGEIVPYGVSRPPVPEEAQAEAFYRRFPRLKGRRLLLFLGRFDPKKGCDLLIASFARLAVSAPDVMLVMAGPLNTQHAHDLQDMVPDEVADRVVWTGMVQGAEKWGAFRAADAFITPSHTENYCIAAVESLACGLPVLISNRVNIHREVLQDEAGYVEKDDPDGCDALISRWLRTRPDDWAAMRVNARLCFDRHFEIEQSYQIYRRALQRYADGDRRPNARGTLLDVGERLSESPERKPTGE